MSTNNGVSTQSFASYKTMPLVPYKIIEKLALSNSENAEKIWKLLKYTDELALFKPNLTYDEKLNMVWTPTKENASQENLFNVFLKPLVTSSLNTDVSQTQLKIYRNTTNATTQYSSVINYEFDIITNEIMCMIYNDDNILVERTDMLEYLLLDELQGIDLGVGSSRLMFTRISGGLCSSQLSINNSKSLYGRSLMMILEYYDNTIIKGGDCEW